MEIVKKELPIKIKKLKDRVIRFIASTENEDRDGDIMSLSGWDFENFKKNNPFVWGHDYKSPENAIGEVVNWETTNKELIMDVRFASTGVNQKADLVYDLYQDNVLKSVSVGFIPKESEPIKGRGRKYTKQELLELSAVILPSNPEAHRRAIQKGIIEDKTTKNNIEVKILEETENEIRFRVKEPGKFKEGSFRRITIKKDKPKIFGIIGKLKGETSTTLQSLRFPKDDGWTKDKAKKWISDNPEVTKSFDLCDYLEMVNAEGKAIQHIEQIQIEIGSSIILLTQIIGSYPEIDLEKLKILKRSLLHLKALVDMEAQSRLQPAQQPLLQQGLLESINKISEEIRQKFTKDEKDFPVKADIKKSDAKTYEKLYDSLLSLSDSINKKNHN